MSENVDMSIPLVEKPALLFQSLLGMDKIITMLKSQEVHHVVNNDLLNVVVENNYMLPENHRELERKYVQEQELLRIQKQRGASQSATTQSNTQSASTKPAFRESKPNINPDSMRKLNDIYKVNPFKRDIYILNPRTYLYNRGMINAYGDFYDFEINDKELTINITDEYKRMNNLTRDFFE